MSDPNQFQPPPPPTPVQQDEAPRPVKLRPVAIGLFVIGLVAIVVGIAKILPGGIGTGDQRIGPIGTWPSSRVGAVRIWPLSTRSKRPMCRTVGRMR